MPLPSSTIGQNNFNPIVAGQMAQNDQSQFLVKNLSNLGASIADSISINNMRREAQEQGPAYAQQLQQGLGAIEQGDISGGLSQIYQTNSRFSSNPLLSKVGQQAAQGAGYLANGKIDSLRQENQFLQQNAMQERQNKAMKDRTEYVQGQENYRAGMDGGNKPMTANQKILAVESFNKMADESLADLDSGDPEKFLMAYEKYANFKGTLVKAGAYVDMPHYDKVAHEKLDELNTQLDEYAKRAQSGEAEESWWKGGGKIEKIVDQIKQQKARIIKANKRALAEGYEFPEQQQQPQGQPQAQQAPQFQEGQIVKQGGATYKYTNGNFVPVQ